MPRRNLKWMALVLVTALAFASLSSLAAIRDQGPVEVEPSQKERVARLLIPNALERAETDRQARATTRTETRRLDELQAQLGVYRPWPKSGN